MFVGVVTAARPSLKKEDGKLGEKKVSTLAPKNVQVIISTTGIPEVQSVWCPKFTNMFGIWRAVGLGRAARQREW